MNKQQRKRKEFRRTAKELAVRALTSMAETKDWQIGEVSSDLCQLLVLIISIEHKTKPLSLHPGVEYSEELSPELIHRRIEAAFEDYYKDINPGG